MLKNKMTKIAAIVMSLAMFLCTTAFAVPETNTAAPIEKLSQELKEVFGLAGDAQTNTLGTQKAPVMVWFEDGYDLESEQLAAHSEARKTVPQETLRMAQYPYADELITHAYADEYIRSKREAAVEYYTQVNTQRLNALFPNAENYYISKYSPVILAEVTAAEALAIAEDDAVVDVNYYHGDVAIDEPLPDTNNPIRGGSTHITVPLINADDVHNRGYTGSGVKVGVLEASLPYDPATESNPYTNVTVKEDSVYSEDLEGTGQLTISVVHAHNVLDVLMAVAPGAQFYCAGGAYEQDGEDDPDGYISNIEWLLDQGVNVINASVSVGESLINDAEGDANNTYGEVARWLDHIAFNHDVHFVQAAGNYNSSQQSQSERGIISGAMAYNILTVGNLDCNNTATLNDDVLHVTSAYNDTSSGAYKPDILGPGNYGASFGTSFSAPHVAGTIALLCQRVPALKYLQHEVKAILIASTLQATKSSGATYPRYVPGNTMYRYYGAGLVDADAARWVAGSGRYASGSISAGQTKNYYMTVSSGDTLMRVALAYSNYIKYESGETHTPGSEDANNGLAQLKLRVYAPSGTRVAASYNAQSNVEAVEFVPTEYGTYRIEVTMIAAPTGNHSTVYYGVSWR